MILLSMINRNPWVKIQTTIICTEQSKVNGVVSSAGILYTAQGVRPHSGFFPPQDGVLISTAHLYGADRCWRSCRIQSPGTVPD